MTFTYPEVGATAGELPSGYDHLRESRHVGSGRRLFDRCVTRLMQWEMHRGAGLTVIAPDSVGPGVEARLGVHLGPLRTWAPVRVVYVVDDADRQGFAYGSLPGHPEQGEERFTVSLGSDEAVRFEVTAFSRPARWFSRLGGPVTTQVQRTMTRRYLAAIAPALDTGE